MRENGNIKTGAAIVGCLLFLILASSAPGKGAENRDIAPRRVFSDEWGFNATFPATSKVCLALSGSHIHGYYAWFDTHHKCHRSSPTPRVSAISIYVDDNSLNAVTPEMAVKGWCGARGSQLVDLSKGKSLTLAGRHSAVCVDDGRDGSIEITVMAAAGRQINDDDSAQSYVPARYYAASLVTYPGRVDGDLVKFRQFLRSFVFTTPR